VKWNDDFCSSTVCSHLEVRLNYQTVSTRWPVCECGEVDVAVSVANRDEHQHHLLVEELLVFEERDRDHLGQLDEKGRSTHQRNFEEELCSMQGDECVHLHQYAHNIQRCIIAEGVMLHLT